MSGFSFKDDKSLQKFALRCDINFELNQPQLNWLTKKLWIIDERFEKMQPKDF